MISDRFRQWVLALYALSLAGLLAAFATASYLRQKAEDGEHFAAVVQESAALFDALVAEETSAMGAVLTALSGNHAVLADFARKDRAALLEDVGPLFERLKDRYRISHFFFIDTDRKVLLRLHEPGVYGERIDRLTLLQAERSGKTSSGLELGPLGTFTLRVVMPWRRNDRLVGYVELGEEVDHLLAEMARLHHVDWLLFIKKRYLTEGRWLAGVAMLGRAGEWTRFPQVVLSAATRLDLPEAVLRHAAQACGGNGATGSTVTVEGRTFVTSAVGFPDVAQRPVGCLYAAVDLTQQLAEEHRFLSALTAVGAIVGAAMFAAFYLILARVRSRLFRAERDRSVLLRESSRDALTGLYNRRHLHDMLVQEVLAARSEAHPLTVLMLDLDRFKQVNDSHGHACGDKLLVEAAKAVLGELRETDRAVRYGGEEFLILLPGSSLTAAMEVAERLGGVIGDLAIACEEHEGIGVTASIGVACYPEDALTAERLLKVADDALYAAKASGRNQVGRPRTRQPPSANPARAVRPGR